MKIKFLNKNIIYFTRKTNSIIFSYYVGDVLIVKIWLYKRSLNSIT
jgi:hypothetical protein